MSETTRAGAACDFCQAPYPASGALVEGANDVFICFNCSQDCRVMLAEHLALTDIDLERLEGHHNRCVVEKCRGTVVAEYYRVQQRTIVKTFPYCHECGENFLPRYKALSLTGDGLPGPPDAVGVAYDVEAVGMDFRRGASSHIFLREVGGTHRIDIPTSSRRALALRWELCDSTISRGVRDLVMAFEGCPDRVEITSGPNGGYEAALRTRNDDEPRVVALNVAEAIRLAVCCNWPILVAQKKRDDD